MTKAKHDDAKDRAKNLSLLPLVALGGGLAAAPAGALELGDVTLQSNLGQPLRASIAYALAPNEMVADTCITVSPHSTSGVPGPGVTSVQITERAIVITGQSVVREPMLAARVTVSCPYAPHLSREYTLFVDPAPVAEAAAAAAAMQAARPEAEPVAQREASPTPAYRAPVDTKPIGQSSRYQVRPGESLGEIVQRIENRGMSLWPAVNMIFAANPDAFVDNDPNRLKAGSWLTIPSLDGSAPVVAAADVTPQVVPDSTASAYEPEATQAVPAEAPAATEAAPEETLAPVEEVADEAAVTTPNDVAGDSTDDLKPGDVVYDYELVDNGETIVIPDTELDAPQTTATSPNVPTAVISTGARSESTSLIAWLIGGGLAIIAALVLFGRRARRRFGRSPAAPEAAAVPSSLERDTETVATFDDYDIEDDSPTEENLALDADLGIGTGLEEGTDMEIAHDFAFASTTELDIELPFEPEAEANDTDIIAPMQMNVESILESEILPEDDDYDMSVIVDATKMPQPEDVTERDLRAVEVGLDEETLIADNYTISKEVDYDILEQDYEDELTATQALNQEIERAAADLAAELDATAELPIDPDDEKTAEFEASYDPNDTNAVTVNMSAEDKTAEMPVANDDDTAEMEISGGTVDTKRLG